ncbi:MAG: helix-turn-helix domain-containing protein [Flavonifractor plautii]|nr:helix-turn-helix domain-containing protein [Flavonifractor plautii]
MTRPTSFDDLPLVMTIEDVAEILQVSKSTTYQLARSEQLRSIHVGQRLRILRTDFVAYLTGGIPYPECQPCFADLPLLLTVPDLQPILRLGRNSVLELIHTEQIRCIRVSHQIRVLKHEL